jgi:hypothetical protein
LSAACEALAVAVAFGVDWAALLVPDPLPVSSQIAPRITATVATAAAATAEVRLRRRRLACRAICLSCHFWYRRRAYSRSRLFGDT